MKLGTLLLCVVVMHSGSTYVMENNYEKRAVEIKYQQKLRQDFECAKTYFNEADILSLEIIKKHPAGFFQFTGFKVNMTEEKFKQIMLEPLNLHDKAYKLLQSIILDNKAHNDIKNKAQLLFNKRKRMGSEADSIFSFSNGSNMYAMDDKEFSSIVSIASRNWSQAKRVDSNEWKLIANTVALRSWLRLDVVKACSMVEEFYKLMKESFFDILSGYPYQDNSALQIVNFAAHKYVFDDKLERERNKANQLLSQTKTLLMNIKNDENADDEIRKEVDLLCNKLTGRLF